MRTLCLGLAAAMISCSVSAATIEVVGVSPADFASYTTRDVTIGQTLLADPWPDAGARVDATVVIEPNFRIDVFYRGGVEDWLVDFGDGRSLSGQSSPGDAVRGLSVANFLSLFFTNEGTGVPLTDPSVAVQAFGNMLEIGWDGTSSERNIGDTRLVAVLAPIPLPAGWGLLLGALAALGACARRGVTKA